MARDQYDEAYKVASQVLSRGDEEMATLAVHTWLNAECGGRGFPAAQRCFHIRESILAASLIFRSQDLEVHAWPSLRDAIKLGQS